MRITFSTAGELISNYKQNHWPIINGACPSLKNNPAYPNVQDSRCVWFSLAELQSFMDDITKANGNGIRFYFGEYSADVINAAEAEIANGLPPVDADCDNNLNGVNQNIGRYTGMQTIVMVPTTRNIADTMNIDFNLDPNVVAAAAVSNTDPVVALPDNYLSAMNHGGMAPPPFKLAPGQDYYSTCGAFFLDL